LDELTQREESMTTIRAMRLASVVTAINVLVATGFSIAAIIRPQYLVPAAIRTEASLLLAMYAAAPRIPLALLVLGAIYKQATPALLILGALAGAMQLLDAGIGLYEHDLGKCAGPLFIAALQFFVVYLLHRSVRIMPQTKRGYGPIIPVSRVERRSHERQSQVTSPASSSHMTCAGSISTGSENEAQDVSVSSLNSVVAPLA
jgi:hypothetical protein